MSTSGVSSGSLTSLSIITQAYLNVTQSITQGFYNQQIVKVDCKKNSVHKNPLIRVIQKYFNIEQI